jgi:hypothetical protein
MLRPQTRSLYQRLFALSILSACLIVVSLFYPSVEVSACDGNCPIRYCLKSCATAARTIIDTSESGHLSYLRSFTAD